MKIAVLNFSGNVGKSTIARHLLAPRMPKAGVVAVETINSDSASDNTIRGADFGKLQQDLQLEDVAIVDVGASNVEQFLALMRQYHGSQEDFDLYLVPTVPVPKQQRDTTECIVELANLGVPAHKIFVLFNLVEAGQDIESTFEPIFQFVDALHLCMTDPQAVIFKNDVFGLIRNSGQTLAEVVADQTDLKAAIRDSSDPAEKMALAERLSIRRLAVGVNKNLDEVFALVMQSCQAG
ncbi:StbB family protein [Limnohabitans radicicola]|uniref:StbB n=1 Tax=Limnohabitans radicicola TaxID=2771427 RepID=A0A927IMK4_9BURK|nr:StbB family protein [Limnohabitans radicicola]MBD8051097.1 StbB [Limnohabitans radicicola]